MAHCGGRATHRCYVVHAHYAHHAQVIVRAAAVVIMVVVFELVLKSDGQLSGTMCAWETWRALARPTACGVHAGVRVQRVPP